MADTLGLPYLYVRATPKDHGLENLIEGNLMPGKKIVVIEDLVSTGGSFAEDRRDLADLRERSDWYDMPFQLSVPYGVKRFHEADITLVPLCTYSVMLEVAEEKNYISPAETEGSPRMERRPGRLGS